MSSPVKECGALKRLTTTSSIIPESPVMVPTRSVFAGWVIIRFSFDQEEKIASTISNDFSPEHLITAMPPEPGGVDMAHIVEGSYIVFDFKTNAQSY